MTRYDMTACAQGARARAAIDRLTVLAARPKMHFPDRPMVFGAPGFPDPVTGDGLDRPRAAGAPAARLEGPQ